jgi:hypothetical protein
VSRRGNDDDPEDDSWTMTILLTITILGLLATITANLVSQM